MITVWKKALRCISVKDWVWEYVILELECDESLLLEFPKNGNKCRVPEVKLCSVHTHRIRPDERREATAPWCERGADAAAATITARDRIVPDEVFAKDEYRKALDDYDVYTALWYGRHNFSNLQDRDIVSWYDHTKWTVGEVMKCHRWEGKEYGQCAAGIHVFKTRELAEAYMF